MWQSGSSTHYLLLQNQFKNKNNNHNTAMKILKFAFKMMKQ